MSSAGPSDPFGSTPTLPRFPVSIRPPLIGRWRDGNAGLPGVISMRGDEGGPHLVLMSLMHGNEIAGAIVLDRLLRDGLRPSRGRITLVFANLDAFDRFDVADPTASRFVHEDMNRIWDEDQLDGPRVSSELVRGRQLRRVIDDADIVFDLHTMLWEGAPLILCGQTPRGRALALAIGTPPLVVSDHGHAGGRRLIDYRRFSDPNGTAASSLVEAGQHWSDESVETTERAVGSLLASLRMTATRPAPAEAPVRFAEVTDTITAGTGQFAFTSPFRGGDTISRAGTTIALDGETGIATPYDDCILIMPNLRPTRGHTAVRLARYRAEDRPDPKM